MKKSVFRRAALAFGLSFAPLLALGASQAAADCSLSNVAGVYGASFDGFIAESRPNGSLHIFQNKRDRGVGILTLGETGEAEAKFRVFTMGVPQLDDTQPLEVTFTGEWFVNSDCEGEIDLDESGQTVDWIFVAVDDMRQLFIVSGASLAQMTAKRLSSE